MQVEHPPNRILPHYHFNEELVAFSEPDGHGSSQHHWVERHLLDPFVAVFDHDVMPTSPATYHEHGHKDVQQARDVFMQPLHSASSNTSGWTIQEKMSYPEEAWPPQQQQHQQQQQQHRAISPVRTMSSSDNNSSASFSPLVSSAMTPHAFAPHLYSSPAFGHLSPPHISPQLGSRCDSPPLPLAVFQIDGHMGQQPSSAVPVAAVRSSPALSLHSSSPSVAAGLRAMSWDESSSNADSDRSAPQQEKDDDDSDYRPSRSSAARRKGQASGKPRNKVAKRAPARRPPSTKTPRLAAAGVRDGPTSRKSETDLERRHFTCPSRPYGCPTTFATKNEWKRHVVSQHLCLGFWRCDLCPDHDRHPNDFNRKDLFTQHLRRMHSPAAAATKLMQPVAKKSEARPSGSDSGSNTTNSKPRQKPVVRNGDFEGQLEVIRQRCWVQARQPPPFLTCIFCNLSFTADTRCEDFLEHVGRHLAEAADQPGPVDIDECHRRHSALFARDCIFRDWMLDNGLLQHDAHSRLELVTRVPAIDSTPRSGSAKRRPGRPSPPAVVSRSNSVDAEGDPDD